MAEIIGIDLGTTFSVVAHVDQQGRPESLPNEEGEILTPSVVFFDRTGTVVGREAVKAGEAEPQRVAQFAKRDIGDETYNKNILGHSFPPEVIEALVLRKLKRDAELRLGAVEKAVVTVPAYFNEPRRKATQDAGRMAGLEVIDILNEPTAAALAYGIAQGFLTVDGDTKEPERVLVYDLGGGTFDVTLVEIGSRRFHAVATAGDVQLGGIDWDERLAKLIAEQFERQLKLDFQDDESNWARMLHMANELKLALTAREEARAMTKHEGKVAQINVLRAQFESLTADLLDRTRLTVRRLLNEASLTWNDLTRVLLVGGSTRMPMVRRMLEEESGMRVDRSLSPDEAVAHGAAIYAAMLGRQGAAAPTSTHATAKNSATPGLGDFTIRNVNSHHLGVLGVDPQTREPRRKIVIARNTPLPAKETRRFQTSRDNQANVVVAVVEGGTDTGEGATNIGKCVVSQLPPNLPAGTAVHVMFHYTGDGRLHVSASVPSAGIQATMLIQRNSGLSAQEIDEWSARLREDIAIGEESTDEAAEVIIEENQGANADELLSLSPAPEEDSESKSGGDQALSDFLNAMNQTKR